MNQKMTLLTIVFSLFFSSLALSDTIDFYHIYYNDSLIYKSSIGRCDGSYQDTNNVFHIRCARPEVVYLDHIDPEGILKIDYYRDYGMNYDTVFLELQSDSGDVLKQYSKPVNIPEGSRVISITGNELISVLKNAQSNSVVLVYYDLIIREQEASQILYLKSADYKYVLEEHSVMKLLKIVVRKL